MTTTDAAQLADGAKPFLAKAYELVDDPETDDIISWSPSGDHFVVRNPEKFTSEVLPRNFKHNNFSSFIRQLNTYGFRKMEKDKWAFGHESFVRGKPHLLPNITRKRGAPSRKRNPNIPAEMGPATDDPLALSDDEGVLANVGDPLASFPFGLDDLAERTAKPPTGKGTSTGAGTAATAAGCREAASDATAATTVLAEIVRMSQMQAAMLQQVKELQHALHVTQESQRMTRATVSKVVGFLQHMHGGNGTVGDGAGGAGSGNVGVGVGRGGGGGGPCAVQGMHQPGLLRGPQMTDMFGAQTMPQGHGNGPAPTAKRRRLHDDSEPAGLPNGDLNGAVGVDGIPKLVIPGDLLDQPVLSPPVAVNLMPGARMVPGQLQPLFSPKTIEASRSLERELSQVADAPAGDLDAIDIDSVLNLLNGIEQEASRPIEAGLM